MTSRVPPRRRSTSLLFLCVTSAVVVVEHGAFGQSPAPSAQAQLDADQHDKRAFESLKRGDAESARLELNASYALVASSKTLWNLLVAEADSHHPLDALNHLKTYLADPQVDPKRKEQGAALRSDLMAQVGHVQVAVPADVPVKVDGVPISVEQGKQAIDVMPGKHAVDAVFRAGTRHKDVNVPAGKDTLVSFDVSSEGAAPGAAAPSPSSPPSTGEDHGLRAPPPAAWILGAVAVAGLGTGIAFSLSAKSKKDDIANNPTACADVGSAECARIRDLDDAGRRNSTIAWIAYGGAGAALVAGGVLWAISPKKKPTTGRANVVPLAAPGVAGLRLQAIF